MDKRQGTIPLFPLGVFTRQGYKGRNLEELRTALQDEFALDYAAMTVGQQRFQDLQSLLVRSYTREQRLISRDESLYRRELRRLMRIATATT